MRNYYCILRGTISSLINDKKSSVHPVFLIYVGWAFIQV